MLMMVGIKKNVDINIREQMTISDRKRVGTLKALQLYFKELVILSTCNRTEIYFNLSLAHKEEALKKIFEVLQWDSKLTECTFLLQGDDVVKHIFEVICGFHSRILGEEQILGQVKSAYEESLKLEIVNSKLGRLFQEAISCGKRFRHESKLYEIPVSSSSIAVNKAIDMGVKRLMIFGYGTMGRLVVKHALANKFEEVNLVVRDKEKASDLICKNVKILDYYEAKNKMNFMDGIIACTSAPHTIIKKEDINELGKEMVMIDLALPRDIEVDLMEHKRVILYDIDDISKLDFDNRRLREVRMEENRYIIEQYKDKYKEWIDLRNVSQYIQTFKENGDNIVEDRRCTFANKIGDEVSVKLASKLIKSTSDYYINRAINVLKEERIMGSEEECLRILKKIFAES